jgi:DNA-binding response OmpR family regulator
MTAAVLIADDSLTVRMSLTETLGTAGFDATACASIAEARAALAARQFDLVILDVLFPDGDGIELLREIRDDPTTRDLPVILLSTEAEVADRVRGLRTGADDYVGKPYESAYLVGRARALLRSDETAVALETVLVIDDSPTYRGALKEALQSAGYVVATAESGEEGLRVAADRRPTAIIVDGVLPGADGAAVIRRIRLDAALRGTPCLLLTGSEDDRAEIRALESGADAFVRKEESIAIVLSRLNAMLRGASPSPQLEWRAAASLHAPKRILAVDDSETYLQAVAGILRGAGYEVALARSGEAALDLLAVQPVDCILLDLLMPGIGGEETCRRIKAVPATRDTPVIMLTALEDRTAMIRGLDVGADDYISKSSDFEVLCARVLAQMRRKQFEEENRRIREQLLHKELEAAEARTAREVAEARAALVEQLEHKNRELEAFSYSVSHDLRAPLRSIHGFSQALLEDYHDALAPQAQDYLRRVCAAAERMGTLIDDLLQLSQVGRTPMRAERVDLGTIAHAIIGTLRRREPDRPVNVVIDDRLAAEGDPGLLRVLLVNLLGNAWKFTAKTEAPLIEFTAALGEGGATVYTIRDNGAGFDMAYAERLFAPFQRLHTVAEFPGTGIGLATVRRIVDRHGGRVWAEGEIGKGAAFSWILGTVTEDKP